MAEYRIRVPGRFAPSDVAWVDVETEKVPTPDGYRMPSGEPLRRRWSVTMAAVARDGYLVLIDGEGDEVAALDEVSVWLDGASEVRYGATRDFDEMVMRGRFTNARRALLPRVTWPAVPGAEKLPWVNVGCGADAVERGADVPSRDVPRLLRSGEPMAWERCAIHCMRDAAALVLSNGATDAAARRWLTRWMNDWEFCLRVLYSEPDEIDE